MAIAITGERGSYHGSFGEDFVVEFDFTCPDDGEWMFSILGVLPTGEFTNVRAYVYGTPGDWNVSRTGEESNRHGYDIGGVMAVYCKAGAHRTVSVARLDWNSGDFNYILTWRPYRKCECTEEESLETVTIPTVGNGCWASFGDMPAGLYRVRYCSGAFIVHNDAGYSDRGSYGGFAWGENEQFAKIVAVPNVEDGWFGVALPLWNSTGTWLEDIVVYWHNRLYRSLSSNSGNDPETSPAYWEEVPFKALEGDSGGTIYADSAAGCAQVETTYAGASTEVFAHSGGRILMAFADHPYDDNRTPCGSLPTFGLCAAVIPFKEMPATVTRTEAMGGDHLALVLPLFGPPDMRWTYKYDASNPSVPAEGGVRSGGTLTVDKRNSSAIGTIDKHKDPPWFNVSCYVDTGATAITAKVRVLFGGSIEKIFEWDLTPDIGVTYLGASEDGDGVLLRFRVKNTGYGPTVALAATLESCTVDGAAIEGAPPEVLAWRESGTMTVRVAAMPTGTVTAVFGFADAVDSYPEAEISFEV